MRKDELNVQYFNKKTNVAQSFIYEFFLILTARGPFHRKDFK